MIRYATVRGNGLTLEGLERYLPANYSVVGKFNIIGTRTTEGGPNDAVFVIAGTDNAGWTLDDYVIPRLASGLIWAKELVER